MKYELQQAVRLSHNNSQLPENTSHNEKEEVVLWQQCARPAFLTKVALASLLVLFLVYIFLPVLLEQGKNDSFPSIYPSKNCFTDCYYDYYYNSAYNKL